MDYCYDLLNASYDLPQLVLEIAQRIKKKARHGIYECIVNSTIRNGSTVSIEFKTNDGEYITAKFNSQNSYYYQTLASLGAVDLDSINKNQRFSVSYNRDVEGFDNVVVIGRIQ